MSTTRFNILEQVILEKGVIRGADHCPRFLVIRRSLSPLRFKEAFGEAPERPGFPHVALLQSEALADWAAAFLLDPLANSTEREILVLDSSHYGDRRRSTRSSVIFSFSVPVPTKGGHLFYGEANWGPLAAHGFLCSFEGTFESPESIAYLTVWRS